MCVIDCIGVSLYFEGINDLSPSKIHDYAALIEMDEGHFSYLFIKPERLVLHHLLAQLVMRTKIDNKKLLENKINSLTSNYNALFPGKCASYTYLLQKKMDYFKSMLSLFDSDQIFLKEDKCDEKEKTIYSQAKFFYEKIKKNRNAKILPYLTEPDIQIAFLIAVYEQHHYEIVNEIKENVFYVVQEAIDNKIVSPLDIVPINAQQFFGLTGPVASGKTYNKAKILETFKNQSAVFISSDDWHDILVKPLKMDQEQKRCGKFTLSEAWFIKKLMWKLLEELNEQEKGIHIIQEAMSPLRLNIPATGKIIIFMNTAMPEKAILRLNIRNRLLERYVSEKDAFNSYHWSWCNLVEYLNNDWANQNNIYLKIIDMDAKYIYPNQSEKICEHLATIATYQNNTLNILNLERFISFISRGYIDLNDANSKDSWMKLRIGKNELEIELKKLLHLKYELVIQLNSKVSSVEKIIEESEKRINASKTIQCFFNKHKKEKNQMECEVLHITRSLTC